MYAHMLADSFPLDDKEMAIKYEIEHFESFDYTVLIFSAPYFYQQIDMHHYCNKTSPLYFPKSKVYQ